jgi:hypothetical protein
MGNLLVRSIMLGFIESVCCTLTELNIETEDFGTKSG